MANEVKLEKQMNQKYFEEKYTEYSYRIDNIIYAIENALFDYLDTYNSAITISSIKKLLQNSYIEPETIDSFINYILNSKLFIESKVTEVGSQNDYPRDGIYIDSKVSKIYNYLIKGQDENAKENKNVSEFSDYYLESRTSNIYSCFFKFLDKNKMMFKELTTIINDESDFDLFFELLIIVLDNIYYNEEMSIKTSKIKKYKQLKRMFGIPVPNTMIELNTETDSETDANLNQTENFQQDEEEIDDDGYLPVFGELNENEEDDPNSFFEFDEEKNQIEKDAPEQNILEMPMQLNLSEYLNDDSDDISGQVSLESIEKKQLDYLGFLISNFEKEISDYIDTTDKVKLIKDYSNLENKHQDLFIYILDSL